MTTDQYTAPHRTVAEVAAMLGCSECNVRQVERVALRKMKREIERRAAEVGVSVRDWLLGEHD